MRKRQEKLNRASQKWEAEVEAERQKLNRSELEQELTDAAEKAQAPATDEWNQLHNKAAKDRISKRPMERWDLYKTQFGLEFLPFFTADGLYNRFIEPNFSDIKAGFDSSPISQLETQVKLWERVSHNISMLRSCH